MFTIKKTKENKDLLLTFQILFLGPLFFALIMVPLSFSEYKTFFFSSSGSIFIFIALISYECAWLIANFLLKSVFTRKMSPELCSVLTLIPSFFLLISCLAIITGPSLSLFLELT